MLSTIKKQSCGLQNESITENSKILEKNQEGKYRPSNCTKLTETEGNVKQITSDLETEANLTKEHT